MSHINDLSLRGWDKSSSMYNGLASATTSQSPLLLSDLSSITSYTTTFCVPAYGGQYQNCSLAGSMVLTITILHMPHVEKKRLPNIMV